MEIKMCHNCTGDMYPDGNGWKCRACGVCMDENGRYYMPAPPPLTNADKIRRMSNDELAEYLCGLNDCDNDNCPGAHLCVYGSGKANGLKRWLEEPYREDADE